MATWFYNDNKGKQGPFTDKELKNLVLEGRIEERTPLETDTGESVLARDVPGLFLQEPPTQKWTSPPVLPMPLPQISLGIPEKKVVPPPIATAPEVTIAKEKPEPARKREKQESESEKFIWYTQNRRSNICCKITETKFRNLIRLGWIDENAFFTRKDPGFPFRIREKVETYPDFWDLCPPKTRLHEEDIARLAWMVAWRMFLILLLCAVLFNTVVFLKNMILHCFYSY